MFKWNTEFLFRIKLNTKMSTVTQQCVWAELVTHFGLVCEDEQMFPQQAFK